MLRSIHRNTIQPSIDLHGSKNGPSEEDRHLSPSCSGLLCFALPSVFPQLLGQVRHLCSPCRQLDDLWYTIGQSRISINSPANTRNAIAQYLVHNLP